MLDVHVCFYSIKMSDQFTVTAKYKTAHLLIWLRLRTKKGLQGGKIIQQRSEFVASRGPYCFYQFWLMPCALCTHVCVSTTLSLLSFAWLPHCWSFPELGPMTQISASLLSHLDNINERTNRIGDLTRHRVSSCQPN